MTSGGNGMRASRVCMSACPRRMPAARSLDEVPLRRFIEAEIRVHGVDGRQMGCNEPAATVPCSASHPMYAATMSGVAGSGCRPLPAAAPSHHLSRPAYRRLGRRRRCLRAGGGRGDALLADPEHAERPGAQAMVRVARDRE
eukprot:CAMPEP_0182839882 /NCGR_PEP_ID=MMETSP0006_2-20121128/24116_1 /TAXON_ID=97485 /ORGANISM="Prymnesium parvum, Strain Texoma1" /LENGTH=141 /DNA_ID=CAMNT_0024969087 /DNA_START=658 /DNA_END=1083 /DNA_ORIENTATION=+